MIRQNDSLGCGVAATALVLGISYDKALRQFDMKKVKSIGCYCKDIIEVLEENNFQARYKYIKENKKKSIYRTNTIVFIKRSKRYPFGHYLVRTDNGWHDSWINFPKFKNVKGAKSGIRKRLPGKAIYAIFIDK